MSFYEKIYGRGRTTKYSRLICNAHYEIRALKSNLSSAEIKKLRKYVTEDFNQVRNVYAFITDNENSERASMLCCRCATLLFPYEGVREIKYHKEAFTRCLIIDTEYENEPVTRYRLYYTALELVFMRATFEELRAIIAFLVDDTKNLNRYNFKEWIYRDLDFVIEIEEQFKKQGWYTG